MKKLLVFEMNEFMNLVKKSMNGICIDRITTNIKNEVCDGEEIFVDCLDLRMKKPLGQVIKTITDLVGYVDIKQDINDESFLIASVEITDLLGIIIKATGEPVIESYEIFEANFNDDFREHIAFHIA